MGATSFQFKVKAVSISDAYKNAVSEAREEYGNDSYNGTISTTNGIFDATQKFKASGKSLDKFINDALSNGCSKWGNAWGICTVQPKTNSNKIKSQVEHVVSKGTKKWELVYVVEDWDRNEIGAKKTKGDAVKIGRAHTEKTQKTTRIHIEKRLVGSGGAVATIRYKSSTNETKGEYVLFGIAAE
jgi:hypothetical protein